MVLFFFWFSFLFFVWVLVLFSVSNDVIVLRVVLRVLFGLFLFKMVFSFDLVKFWILFVVSFSLGNEVGYVNCFNWLIILVKFKICLLMFCVMIVIRWYVKMMFFVFFGYEVRWVLLGMRMDDVKIIGGLLDLMGGVCCYVIEVKIND